MQNTESQPPVSSSESVVQKTERIIEDFLTEQEQSATLDYDEILQVIGDFGPFQRKVFSLMTIPVAFAACSVMSYNFVGGAPDYRCYIPTCDNGTETEYYAPWINNSAVVGDTQKVGSCERYNINFTTNDECYSEKLVSINETGLTRCDAWVFDNSIFKSTLVTEFGLTCEKEWLQTLVNTLFMAGMLIGSFPFGSLADKIGRRLCFFAMVLWTGIFNLACAFAPNYIVFTTLRAFAGATAESLFTIGFVTGVETIGIKYRTVCGLCFHICYTIGNMLTGMGSYFIRDWRLLQIVLSAPAFLLLFYWWFLPESPRWLISQGRYVEAQSIILKAAKANGRIIPSHMLLALSENKDVNEIQNSTEVLGETQGTAEKRSQQETVSLIELFKSPILRKRAFFVFVAWMVVGFAYFGLSMASTNLSGNLYLNYELTAFIEIPGTIFEMVFTDRLGKSILLPFAFLFAGLSCITAGVVKGYPMVTITFSMLGKLFVNIAFSTVYSFSAELFPTAARSAVMGICVTLSGLGNILSPVGKREKGLPYLIFGIAALIAGGATIILPETTGQSLPETLQQAEDLEKIGPGIKRLFKRNQTQSDCYKNEVNTVEETKL